MFPAFLVDDEGFYGIDQCEETSSLGRLKRSVSELIPI